MAFIIKILVILSLFSLVSSLVEIHGKDIPKMESYIRGHNTELHQNLLNTFNWIINSPLRFETSSPQHIAVDTAILKIDTNAISKLRCII